MIDICCNYIINNKSKLYNLFVDDDKLFVIIEISGYYFDSKLKPIKIQKYMNINELPEKVSDLFVLDNNIKLYYEKIKEHNIFTQQIYHQNFYVDITIYVEGADNNKFKISYSNTVTPL